jgi:hypothetical protein
MDHPFDKLAKTLAGTMPRREALWCLGGWLGVALLGALGLPAKAHADSQAACNKFCSQFKATGNDVKVCKAKCLLCPSVSMLCGFTVDALVCCTGTCCNGVCCPAAAQGCCNAVCTDLNGVGNCGACGQACGMGQACCGGACVYLNTDVNNCGTCGVKCSPGQSCVNGTCHTCSCSNNVKDCNETDVDCGGDMCPPCGSGQRCLVGSDCVSGVCLMGVCQ